MNKFSHWLRSHRFTVWTDNNLLKYILTKPRLDACEQRWVALKLWLLQGVYMCAVMRFLLSCKHISIGKKQALAPYSTLLKQADNFRKDDVQNMFRLSAELSELRDVNAQTEPGDTTIKAVVTAGSVHVHSDEISAVMQTHKHWEEAGTVRAISQVQYLESLVAVGQNPVPIFTQDELLTEQVNDVIVNRVKFFTDHGRRPSRRENVYESRGTLRILRQWGKLTTRLGIVYRVSKHPVTKQKAYQYVVPESHWMAVLKGIHDDVGQQGQQRSLGFPVSIYSDQGANFESLLIVELCQLAGIDKTHATPYHSMGNGQAERMNRTLGNMICALPPRSKYGRTARLPVDLMFETVLLDRETVDIDKYVQSLKRDLCEAMKLAQSHSEIHNKKSKGQPVDIGQRVLLANKGERGKKKWAGI
ncbi:hypothetical protein QQF64_018362 [Cirrhinus molitorella]|uniref:Integrase catalytic domain-containing protein n=1 Tax=Cirrhinus molitorella TaxID=172907 RepID=A0ABR3LCC5_9TELE